MGTGRTVVANSRFLALVSGAILVAALLASMWVSSSANAQVVYTEALPNGAQRTTYRLGPVQVTPGQNRIAFRPITGASRPAVNGWITRIKPDLVYEDGTIPESSKVMFHHGVWNNQATGDLFYATGEEKTILDLPDGYGYRYQTNQGWILNDMIHNLTPQAMVLYFEYTLDFVPDTAPEAQDIVRARPIWMDVESGIYPVFDVWRDSGGADGEFTYPQDAENPYPPGQQKNVKTIPQDGVLLHTTGHVHTGGLSTNLYLRRAGMSRADFLRGRARAPEEEAGRLLEEDQGPQEEQQPPDPDSEEGRRNGQEEPGQSGRKEEASQDQAQEAGELEEDRQRQPRQGDQQVEA